MYTILEYFLNTELKVKQIGFSAFSLASFI